MMMMMKKGGNVLNRSVKILAPQSILNTSLEENVLQLPSSVLQFNSTCAPHQNVSSRKVVVIAAAVKTDTA